MAGFTVTRRGIADASSSQVGASQLPKSVVRATTFLTPSGGDDSAAAATAIAAGGLIVMGPGTFLWNTQVPAFQRSTPTRVLGAGIGKTTIKLSSGAPRAFDFAKLADYDTFNDIEISDLTVDCNNVLPAVGSHVLIGTITLSGGVLTKMNIAGLALRRIRTLNVPTPCQLSNLTRNNVYIIIQVNAADNPCTVSDVVLEDIELRGGNIGVSIGGATNDGTGYGNLTHDRIYCTRVKHDTLYKQTGLTLVNGAGQTISTTPSTLTVVSTAGFQSAGLLVVPGVTGPVQYTGTTGTTFTGCVVASGSFSVTNSLTVYPASYASEHIQIGSKDTGLTVALRDCWGQNSQDVGFALLNCRQGVVDNCVAVDSFNAMFQAANFNPNMPADQKKTFRSCEAKLTSAMTPSSSGSHSVGYFMGGSPSQPVYQVVLDDCKFVSQALTISDGQALTIQNPVSRVTLRNFEATATAVNWTLPSTQLPSFVTIANIAGTPLTIEGTLRTSVGGTIALNAQTFAWRDVWFKGADGGCDCTFDIQSHFSNCALTGQAAGSTFVADFNPTQVFTTRPSVRGSYRYVVESFASATETTPFGARVALYGGQLSPGGAQQLIVDGFLIFPDCDAGRLPSGAIGHEVHVGGVNTNGAQAPLGSGVGSVPLVLYPRYKAATSNTTAAGSVAIPGPQASTFTPGTATFTIKNLTGVAQLAWVSTTNTPTISAVSMLRRSDTSTFPVTTSSGGPWPLNPGDEITVTASVTNAQYVLMPVMT